MDPRQLNFVSSFGNDHVKISFFLTRHKDGFFIVFYKHATQSFIKNIVAMRLIASHPLIPDSIQVRFFFY